MAWKPHFSGLNTGMRWHPRHLRMWCTAVALAMAATLSQAQAQHVHTQPASQGLNLPALGDSIGQDLSSRAERRLGDRVMRAIRSDPAILDDPLLVEYIHALWRDLLKAGQQRGEISADLNDSLAWEAFLVRDRSVNAFALPGGYIGVHLGLIAMTTTADELASVLAHEMSHVTQRHIARMMGQQSRTSWMSMASMILGILAASSNPAAAQALIYGGQAANIQGQLNFSRDMEREADRVGYGILADAGFQTGGMARMFEQLQQASRLNDDGSYPYLRTHPLTSERIGEARARIGPDGWQKALQAPMDTKPRAAWHTLMSARAQVLMDGRSDALHRLAQAKPNASASALMQIRTLYAAALAQHRISQTSAAAQSLNQARQTALLLSAEQQAQVSRVLALTETDMLLTLQRPQDAANALLRSDAAPLHTALMAGRPELLLRAKLALTQSNPDGWLKAANELQTHVSQYPADASAWALLSAIWQRLDQPLRAIRADAEATAALGDLSGAIDRVQGARQRFRQPNASEVIELSVLDARLKAWQRQHREDSREDK